MDTVSWTLVWLYIAVVVMAIVLSLMIFTGWWMNGGPKNGKQKVRNRALVRFGWQEEAQETEEAKEVV